MSSSATPLTSIAEGRGHLRRLLLAALLAAAAVLSLGAASALGAPATIRLIQLEPSLGHEIAVTAPGGGTFRADPGQALVRVTPAGATALETTAWCVDARRAIAEGVDYPVDLAGAAELPSVPAAGEVAWLIGRADALIAAAPAPGREAAAIQVAVWQLTGQAADVHAVTGDAALDARVAELRATAAGRAPVTALALTAPAGAVAAGRAATVVVTGTPGAEVALEATAGARLGAAAVTLGPGGSASVTVTPGATGPVIVSARAAGGLAWRAGHLPGAAAPQDMAYVTPTVLTATAALEVAAPTPTPAAPTPAAPAVAVSGSPAPTTTVLRLGKRAPRSARRGRAIGYRLIVVNRGAVTARGVVIRDRLPRGTFLARVPARARISRGTVIWRLGDLAPGARVTVALRLRTLPRASRVVRNVGRASAANAATVRARAATRLRPARVAVRPLRVSPAVTG